MNANEAAGRMYDAEAHMSEHAELSRAWRAWRKATEWWENRARELDAAERAAHFSAHTCETCRWWVDFTRAKAPGGECHHCAPVVSTDGEAAGETLWPWTRKDNVCGTDWAPRLEAPKEG